MIKIPLVPDPKNCDVSVKRAIQLISKKLGFTSTPTFAGLTFTGLTANSLIYPTSTGLLTSLGAATDGQIPIGDTGAVPVLATITGTANQVNIANAAGSITLSTPQDIHTGASPAFAGLTTNLVTKMGAYTLTSSDYTIICNATNGAFTITLPVAVSHTGRVYHVKKIDSSTNAVTVDGNSSETIDNSTTAVLTVQYESITIQSDGSEWWIL